MVLRDRALRIQLQPEYFGGELNHVAIRQARLAFDLLAVDVGAVGAPHVAHPQVAGPLEDLGVELGHMQQGMHNDVPGLRPT